MRRVHLLLAATIGMVLLTGSAIAGLVWLGVMAVQLADDPTGWIFAIAFGGMFPVVLLSGGTVGVASYLYDEVAK